jgi:Family of unknown function (DUF5931)
VGLQAQLWRGIAAFRFASLAYAAVLLVVDRADYDRLVLAWVVLAGMTGWTVVTSYAYAVPARRTRALLTADVAVTAAALLSTLAVQRPGEGSVMPVTATWAAGPVLAWAVAYGRRAGMAAAVVLGLCDIARHRPISSAYHASALNGPILLPALPNSAVARSGSAAACWRSQTVSGSSAAMPMSRSLAPYAE